MHSLFAAFVRPYCGRLVVIVATALVAVGCALAQPIAAQALIQSVETNGAFAAALGVLVGITLVEALAASVHTVVLERTGARAVFDVRRGLADRILRWSVDRHRDERHGELISLLTTDTAQIHTMLVGGVFELVTAVVLAVGACALMIVISPLLFLVTIVAILGSSMVVGVASGRVRALSRSSQDATAAMGAELASSLRAVRTIRTAGATQRYIDRLIEPAARARDAAVALGNRVAVVSPIGQLATQGAFLSVVAVGAIQVTQGAIAFADLLAFLMYVVLVLSPLENGFRAIPVLQRARASWDRIVAAREVPIEEPQRRESRGRIPARGEGRLAPPAPGPIRFDGVDFRYADGAGGVSDATLTVRAGSLCALVGPSGSGKSTMLDLLARLQEPDRGRILLGEADLTSIGRRELSRRVVYMEQSAPMIDGSLADNLRLAAPDADDDRVRHALSDVGLDYLIDEDPRGIHTPLGESGRTLSGGEAQRVALARTMLSPAPIVLIDEPTSRLDAESEARVTAVIDALAGTKTVLVATHRLRSIAHADQVVYLRRDGTIRTGTHAQLVRSSRSYSRLAALSLAG